CGRTGGSARPTPRPPAEVRRLSGGAEGGRLTAHRVAGLPSARREARCVVDVPVPRPRAARAGARHRGRRRDAEEKAEALGRGERGEALEAGNTLARRANGGERLPRFLVTRVRLEVLVAHDLGV